MNILFDFAIVYFKESFTFISPCKHPLIIQFVFLTSSCPIIFISSCCLHTFFISGGEIVGLIVGIAKYQNLNNNKKLICSHVRNRDIFSFVNGPLNWGPSGHSIFETLTETPLKSKDYSQL